MKIVVGLGNPDEKYEATRHNVGYGLVERLAGEKSWNKNKNGLLEYVWIKVNNQEVELVKPLTYMNRSGVAVAYAIKKQEEATVEDLWVVHDDLDLAWGEYKIDWARGPKVHNGVNSVENTLKTKEFWRVRIGVDNRSVEMKGRISGAEFVLMKMKGSEREELEKVLEKIAEEMKERLI